ncbi:hypothetical protein ACHAWO_009125 [Cyclotella atomus]|uniref:Uncharacterized protein n=1 Tax=Cyclotella atomus TaxID=382360 RepID=A0ABD3PBZ0_9STRA
MCRGWSWRDNCCEFSITAPQTRPTQYNNISGKDQHTVPHILLHYQQATVSIFNRAETFPSQK